MKALAIAALFMGVLLSMCMTMLGMLGTYDGRVGWVLPLGALVMFVCIAGIYQIAEMS